MKISITLPDDIAEELSRRADRDELVSRAVAVALHRNGPPQSSSARLDLDDELSALARAWRDARGATSSSLKAAMHPAYQRIIGKGSAAVPFLLRQLRERPDHWFWALMAITGEDPVAPEQRGNLPQMADAWLAWGEAEGYV